eukprot:scaffold13400_cov47-Prasinocladus_malaysianus.AAC.1
MQSYVSSFTPVAFACLRNSPVAGYPGTGHELTLADAAPASQPPSPASRLLAPAATGSEKRSLDTWSASQLHLSSQQNLRAARKETKIKKSRSDKMSQQVQFRKMMQAVTDRKMVTSLSV